MAIASLTDGAQRAADLASCRLALRGGSRSFHLAGRLLPARLSASATALYAYCRKADDAIDACAQSASGAALAALHAQLDRVYAQQPDADPAERSFAQVVLTCGIPRVLLEALLEGFAWDAEGRRYETPAELHAYAVRVAGTVGILMSLLMGRREPAVLSRACDLGVAMQLTNIARDVGEDARMGRLYLPGAWLREVGIDASSWLVRPQVCAALGAVIERLLRTADALYARAAEGVAYLPSACRPGIQAARLLYAEIGEEVRRRGLDSVSARARVGAQRKALLLLRALRAASRTRSALVYAPLPESQALIEAVAQENPRTLGAPAKVAAVSRAEWLLQLFERLEERDQRAALEAAAGR